MKCAFYRSKHIENHQKMYLPRLTLLLTIFYCLVSACKQETKQTEKVDSTKVSIQKEAITQDCSYTQLSKEFDIQVFLKRFKRKYDIYDSCLVNLIISDKITHKQIDTLALTHVYYFPDVFQNCNHVLSYSTKMNIDNEIVDNYYGDIVIADLNFDSKDDIALINNSGGNGGAFYSYYLQKNRKFVLNTYLTDSMTYFPTKINKAKRTLTTYVHAGAIYLGEHIYYLNNDRSEWIEKSRRIIDITKEKY